jgi:hypothetical protein
MSIFRTIPYAVLSGSLLVGGGAYAQSMPTIDQRQDYQQDRIEHGIRDGQITRSEAARLEQGERAIDRAQARARADGVVTQQERARIDRMTDREGREIYRDSHNNQQAWDRGQSWGHTDGRNDGWRDNGGSRDGWGRGGDRDGDRGQHEGWARGEHNGWDGNRPPGIERRDARQDQRIQNGVRDGSLTHGEANRLEHGQDRINRYEARARSDGVVTPGERNRIDNMQNRESRQIYADRHNDRTATGTPTTPPPSGTPTGNGSHNWGNGGWQQGSQAGNTTPTTGTQPTGGSRNYSGWQHAPQAGNTTPTTPSTGTQPAGGSRSWGNNGGYRMQQAAATPQQQAQAPRPTMTRVSSPSPSAGGRSFGGRH